MGERGEVGVGVYEQPVSSHLDVGVGVEVEVGGVKKVVRETSPLGFEDEGGDFWLWSEVKTSLKGESDE